MAGPPSPKRQRVGDKVDEQPDEKELAKINEVLQSVTSIDEEMTEHNDKLAKEILALEAKYDAVKRPLYLKRAKQLKQVPKFWKQCLTNHPGIQHTMQKGDEEVLDYLVDVDVQLIDERGGYKIEMTFESNPFFSNKALWKQVTYDESGEPEATASKIEWTKQSQEFIESCAMLEALLSTEDAEVDEEIKDHIWKSPVEFYLNEGFTMMDEEGDEDEDDDEDGDEGDDNSGEDE